MTIRSSVSRDPHGPPAGGPSLRRVMGIPSLVAFGLAYMVPMTIFTTYGVITTLTEGHLPAAYVVTLVAMLFTACSYAFLVGVIPAAGSAYSFAQRVLGDHVGFVTGWTLMLDYILLPLINYLLIGLYLNAQFPVVPSWVFVLAAIVLVTVLNVIGIMVIRNANMVLVAFQVVFAAVFLGLAAWKVPSGQSLLEPFYSPDMSMAPVVSGAAVLCLSFLGFDAVSTLAEEARDPRRTVPRAILLTTLIGGAFFVVVSWAGHLVRPDWQDFTSPDAAALEIMQTLGGNLMIAFFLAAYISGATASALASQASVSRILFAMGRDGVLPRAVFGRLSRRYRTPVGAIAVVSAISLGALVVDLDLVASVISFGALFAFSLVNLSACKHFLVDEHRRGAGAVVKYGVVPATGFLLTIWLWTSLSGAAFSVGLVWLAAGLVYLAVMTRGFRAAPPRVDLEPGT